MNETNAGGVRRRSVGIVVPLYDEAHVLADSIGRLHAHLEESFPFPFRITIADTPLVPAARKSPAVLPVGANPSLESLEYAS